jgi:predicted nucleic acid-binding Zn ribbon protein
VTPCPRCGAPAERGQLVCVECGERIALTQSGRRRSFESVPAVALLLCVVVLGAGTLGFVLSELTGDDDGQVEAADRTSQPAPEAASGSPQNDAETTPDDTDQQRQGLLLQWPEDVTGYTVVLVTTGDRPAARRVAIEAAHAGLEAGLLDSDDFDLGTDLWIVFAGRFDNQESAERQAVNLGDRYPGAYATQVRPASSQ